MMLAANSVSIKWKHVLEICRRFYEIRIKVVHVTKL